jgi:hypothetical protein
MANSNEDHCTMWAVYEGQRKTPTAIIERQVQRSKIGTCQQVIRFLKANTAKNFKYGLMPGPFPIIQFVDPNTPHQEYSVVQKFQDSSVAFLQNYAF